MPAIILRGSNMCVFNIFTTHSGQTMNATQRAKVHMQMKRVAQMSFIIWT